VNLSVVFAFKVHWYGKGCTKRGLFLHKNTITHCLKCLCRRMVFSFPPHQRKTTCIQSQSNVVIKRLNKKREMGQSLPMIFLTQLLVGKKQMLLFDQPKLWLLLADQTKDSWEGLRISPITMPWFQMRCWSLHNGCNLYQYTRSGLNLYPETLKHVYNIQKRLRPQRNNMPIIK
jgi:hypothetical protein